MSPFKTAAVSAKFQAYPPAVRRKMLALRELVLKTAERLPEVGEVEETLKWGEPAYVTANKAGSTVRMDWKAKTPGQCAVYFNCQTDLVDTFRTLFPNDFEFQGNRALLIPVEGKLPRDELAVCFEASLTYHLKKRSNAKAHAKAGRAGT